MVERKEKWVFNGVEYDNYNDALAAEIKHTKEKVNFYDPTSDIDGFVRRFEVLMIGSKKQRDKNPDEKFGWHAKMPCLLTVNDNNNINSRYLITAPLDVAKIAFSIVSKRLKEGHWYFDEDEKLAQAIVDRNQFLAAFPFLEARAGNEYEGIELEEFDKFDSED